MRTRRAELLRDGAELGDELVQRMLCGRREEKKSKTAEDGVGASRIGKCNIRYLSVERKK